MINPGRIVGVLFLAAFVCYGIGSALVDRPIGVGLMLLNSVVVAAIGALVFGVLRPRHGRTAAIYLLVRTLEAALLAAGVLLVVLMAWPQGNDIGYQLAMIILGIGSVPFCWVVLRERFLPGWLAVCGIVGYVLLAVGALLELGGVAVGLVFAIPGGLFEIALGLVLIARGFRAPVATLLPSQVHPSNDRLAQVHPSNDRLEVGA
jgi:hypothetical protein